MNKAQLQDQIAPGSVGLALSTIWMTYGESFSFVPADLSEVKYAALTAAIGVVCTALVNVVRRYTTKRPTVINQTFDVAAPVAWGRNSRPTQADAERRMPDQEESKT